MNRPHRVNREYPTGETFPEIFGFCERDEASRLISDEVESYDYFLGDELVYRLEKHPNNWMIYRFNQGELTSQTCSPDFQNAAFQSMAGARATNKEWLTIYIPITPGEREQALTIMYYLGGYVGSWLSDSDRKRLLMSDPSVEYLSYSLVPARYVDWLEQDLKRVGLVPETHHISIDSDHAD